MQIYLNFIYFCIVFVLLCMAVACWDVGHNARLFLLVRRRPFAQFIVWVPLMSLAYIHYSTTLSNYAIATSNIASKLYVENVRLSALELNRPSIQRKFLETDPALQALDRLRKIPEFAHEQDRNTSLLTRHKNLIELFNRLAFDYFLYILIALLITASLTFSITYILKPGFLGTFFLGLIVLGNLTLLAFIIGSQVQIQQDYIEISLMNEPMNMLHSLIETPN